MKSLTDPKILTKKSKGTQNDEVKMYLHIYRVGN